MKTCVSGAALVEPLDCQGLGKGRAPEWEVLGRAGADVATRWLHERKTLYQWLHGGYMSATNEKAQRKGWAKSLILLVPEKGIEPSTFSLRMSCSTD